MSCEEKSQPKVPVVKSKPKPVVVFIGDSLTAGYGVATHERYTALLGKKWPQVVIQNAGVSGDTTAGVLRRLDWILGPAVKVVFLAIGSNDGMRGLAIADIRANLIKIVNMVKNRNITLILAEMRIPPNYGRAYATAFNDLYAALAKDLKVPMMPFFMHDVAGKKALNQSDGIHPNPQGHVRMATAVIAYFDRYRLLPKPAQ